LTSPISFGITLLTTQEEGENMENLAHNKLVEEIKQKFTLEQAQNLHKLYKLKIGTAIENDNMEEVEALIFAVIGFEEVLKEAGAITVFVRWEDMLKDLKSRKQATI
jgi:hypothetical protein